MNRIALRIAVKIYDTAWRAIIPAARLSSRLKEGYAERRLAADLPAADLWIQAASAGEAYLAWSLLAGLRPDKPIKALITTNTRQGMDILEKAAEDIKASDSRICPIPGWFPFDRPSLMKRAVRQAAPELMVLLETEIWPGLMFALKDSGIPTWIINARITQKSFHFYHKGKGLLRHLRPEGILAVSKNDASRFAEIFGRDVVFEMPNIKFDRLEPPAESSDNSSGLKSILAPEAKFLVMGSIRRQEESRVKKLLYYVHDKHPDAIIGLFPRHLNRIAYWESRLSGMKLEWTLRSQLRTPVQPGSVILWDTFGELTAAYRKADAVFVGGSLAPLGGQNFIEPLVSGCRPVTGPFLENFLWAGETVFDQGLVFRVNNWRQAAHKLIEHLDNPGAKGEIREKAVSYIRSRHGGTKKACRIIEKYLSCASMKEAS